MNKGSYWAIFFTLLVSIVLYSLALFLMGHVLKGYGVLHDDYRISNVMSSYLYKEVDATDTVHAIYTVVQWVVIGCFVLSTIFLVYKLVKRRPITGWICTTLILIPLFLLFLVISTTYYLAYTGPFPVFDPRYPP